MPDAWPIFFSGRKLHPIQAHSMPYLIRGVSALLSGPTASGKTEAAVAPLFQRHISFKRKELSVLYIAPTKALVNDLYYRIDTYLSPRLPGAIRRYTGDHHEFTDPENVFLVLATPEALDSLQLMRPESLAGVRAVVVDEIHLLHGNARGQQLRHVLKRVEKNSNKPKNPKDVFQKIGMTATLRDMEEVGKLWLGNKAKSFKAGDAREIDIAYLQVHLSESSEKWKKSAQTLADWLETSGTPKALIFGNTRNGTQNFAANLYDILKGSRWPIHWHTGVLTATERERVEYAMKNDHFGLCVATSTLEVGIDIGDIDAIVLADPPFSVNAFLQRIGRGNRKTDVCRVVALYSNEQELALYQALHRCAVTGALDDIHDYDRASVRFQQILSFAWRGVSRDKKPLTLKNLVERTCDDEHVSVVEDMLSTGALENIRGALIPSDKLMDQGEKRQIHTTITGAATLNMVDSATGETLISTSGQGITEGGLFIGGKLKKVTGNVDGSISLESMKGEKLSISTLPATRGKRGLGRRIVWSLGEIAGHNPRSWEIAGDRLTTWGGADYNRLLAALLKEIEVKDQVQWDEYGISGISDADEITPTNVLEWAKPILDSKTLPGKIAAQFCERSRYFSLLSGEIQEEEAQKSIPVHGFMHWLHECIEPEKEEQLVHDIAKTGNKDNQGMTVILKLLWKEGSDQKPAIMFARALTSHLFPVAGSVTGKTSKTPEMDDLDLEDCKKLFRDQTQIAFEFNPTQGNEIPGEYWIVRADGQTGIHCEIEISTPHPWGFEEFNSSFNHIQWLQADFDLASPLGVMGFPRNQLSLHPTATHTLVGLAGVCGVLAKTELSLSNNPDKPIGSWHTRKPDSSNSHHLQSILSHAQKSLWLPKKSDLKSHESSLWFLISDTAVSGQEMDVAKKKEPWGELLNQCQSENLDFEALTQTASNLMPAAPLLRILPLPDAPSCKFMTPVQDKTILVVIPDAHGVILGIEKQPSPDATCRMIQHGIAHILLGHIRPGDEFGHSDTIDTILGIGSLKRWDEDVKALIPLPKPRTLKDCTPHEKACLGLHRMIGEMLGESQHLHPKAEQYQKVIYQRQAAQRLLAQLEEYGGAMLCDGVGLGKTYIATTLLVHYTNAWRDQHKDSADVLLSDPLRFTVLAPNSVVSTWQREALPPLTGFGVPLSSIRVISHTKLSRISRSSAVLKPNPWRELSDLEHLLLSDLVIVDEAHNFRSVSARRTVVLRDLLRLQPRKETNRRVLLLTATPVNNSLEDLQQEVSLLYSRPIPLSDAVTSEGYRRQTVEEIAKRCKRARSPRGPNGDVAPLVVHGDSSGRFSMGINFRDDLDFGPNVQRIGDYLKEQDRKLKDLQEKIRDSSQQGRETEGKTVRIADELLDRIVVQRSRGLCKEIEKQQGSGVKLLFRPDAGEPEKLYYSDEYDGIQDVLARFLPLFKTGRNSSKRPLSLKVYMWYDVREGFKTPDEMSPVVGLQRILVLKRLESSPVAFLITLLRLTVLHAYRVQELLNLCRDTKDKDRISQLKSDIRSLVTKSTREDLEKIITLATGRGIKDIPSDFIKHMANSYENFKASAETDDDFVQLRLFDADSEEKATKEEQLDRLWALKEILLHDFETLLGVTPGLADIIFGRFSREEWPRRFTAGGQSVDWPTSPNWGLRIITDAKLRQLVARLLAARRERQKIIVFSQFSDSLAYAYSVLRACSSFSQQEWAVVVAGLSDLGLAGLKAGEVRALLEVTEVITGDTEDRDEVVNAFAPYYRIGPIPPSDNGEENPDGWNVREAWENAWRRAIDRQLHILLSTDVLAEGVNLQDAGGSINFDVHWNPVRMIQRSGRIDRRLNPAVEKAPNFPELEDFLRKIGKNAPEYYWHGNADKPPLTINMILPDVLEAELLLRERIATKTLAIDFTLGLEQGTGAEARWMENYRYQGISSLNAFQKDRAIEQIASYHQKLTRLFNERGIDPQWSELLNGWFRAHGAGVESPLIGRALLGKKGGDLQVYRRYLEPTVSDGVPHWLWSQKKPGESILNFWLALDGKTFPPNTVPGIQWNPNASLPLRAEDLLFAIMQLFDNKDSVRELEPKEIGRPLLQGITALAAGFLGSHEDRRLINVAEFFLLQLTTFRQSIENTGKP